MARVAAGSPLLAVKNQRGKIQIPPNLISPLADYLLQARGNNMTGAGILGGDFLVVHRTHAVAMAAEDATFDLSKTPRACPWVYSELMDSDFFPGS